MIRVHIDTTSDVVRTGLEAILRGHSEIELAGSAADADVVIREDPPDISDFVAAPAVIVLTDDVPNHHLWRLGVRAVLPRDAPAAQIIAAVHAAASGLVVLPVDAAAAALPAPAEQLGEPLTARELEVLDMLAEGLSNKLIAHRLAISEHTAKFHVNSILAKLNAGTRTEAVMRGVRLGLVKI